MHAVAFAGSRRLIGDAAKNQAAGNVNGTLFDVKRLIGRTYQDAMPDIMHMPFTVVPHKQRPLILVEQEDGETIDLAPGRVPFVACNAPSLTKMWSRLALPLTRLACGVMVPMCHVTRGGQRRRAREAA